MTAAFSSREESADRVYNARLACRPLSYINFFPAGQGDFRRRPRREPMSSIERTAAPDDNAQSPSLPDDSRANHGDSAHAPRGDGSPSSGAFDLHYARPQPLDGPDAPMSDVGANRCAQPPCTARARIPKIIGIENHSLSAHALVKL